jgi:hypothetical protein
MKRIAGLALLLAVTASLTHAAILTGFVIDAQSLNLIGNVNVTVHVLNPDSIAYPTTADQSGIYSINGIVPNNRIYVVVAQKAGYVYSYTRIDGLGSVGSLDTLRYDIYLTPEGTIPPDDDTTSVFGTVLTPTAPTDSLVPVANVQIGLTSGVQHINAMTDSQGRYAARVPLGYYSISVNASGYENLTINGIAVESNGRSVNAVLKSSSTGVSRGRGQSKPGVFALLNAYPSPFNPATTISFILPERGRATLNVYDILGHEVAVLANGDFEGGVEHQVTFNASNLTSGVYFSRLEFGGQIAVKKLVLVK